MDEIADIGAEADVAYARNSQGGFEKSAYASPGHENSPYGYEQWQQYSINNICNILKLTEQKKLEYFDP